MVVNARPARTASGRNASEVALEMGEIAEQEVVGVSLTQFRRTSSWSVGNHIRA